MNLIKKYFYLESIFFREKYTTNLTDHIVFRNTNYFASLNGLRAIGILAVIWHHTVGTIIGMPTLFSNGFQGVTLFFSISGFLITTLLLREKDKNKNINLKEFYIRRSLRIFPLYYFILFLYVLLVIFLEKDVRLSKDFFKNLISFLTYTSNWFVSLNLDSKVIFYFAWSLAAEEQFYLLWPAIEKYVKNRVSLLLMCIVTLFLIATQLFGEFKASTMNFSFAKITGSIQLAICFGVILAHLLHDKKSYLMLKWILGSRLSSIVSFLFVLIILSFFTYIPILVHFSMTLFVATCVYREDHFLAPVLRLKFISYIGMISYGMYLVHMLAKNIAINIAFYFGIYNNKILVFFATTGIAVVVAGLSYRYFESFFIGQKKRLIIMLNK